MRQYRYLLSLIMLTLSISGASIVPYQTAAQSPDLPNVIVTATPVIPPIVLVAHANGQVIVELNINADGTVNSAHVIAGHPLLRKITEDAASRWRFAPMPNGDSVRSLRLTFEYPSTLEEESPINVLPYNIRLKAALPDTVSFIPSSLDAGRSRCKVHGELLKKDKVEIVYGLVGFRRGYLHAQERQFPNANTVAYGGCVILAAKYAEVLYCERCRKAEAKWNLSHRRSKFSV